MEITYHAAKRFLERVIKKTQYNKYEVHRTKEYLFKIFKDVVVTSFSKKIALPGFENDFYVVCKENSIITIIPKRHRLA